MIVQKKPPLWRRYPLRCRFGIHKHVDAQMDVAMGWGVFGGPMVTFRWRCARCGLRGIT